MKHVLDLRKNARVITVHGPGIIENFEVYPPLQVHKNHPWTGPDILDEFPKNPAEGSFIRIGVYGCHPTLEVAYYTVDELRS